MSLLTLVFGLIACISILAFMAKAPSLKNWDELRWGLIYPAAYFFAALMVWLSVSKRSFRIFQLVGSILTLVLLFPIVELWVIGLNQSRLLPQLHLAAIFVSPFLINVVALCLTHRLNQRQLGLLSVIFVIVGSAAVLFGWPKLKPTYERYWSQYVVVKEILSLKSKGWKAFDNRPHIVWRDLNVVGLYADYTPIAKMNPSPICSFPELEQIELSSSSVDDSFFEGIENLEKLRTLRVNRTKVGDATFKRLLGLKDLYSIEARGVPITESGLRAIGQVNSLTSLFLGGLPISKQGVEHLCKSQKLIELELSHTDLAVEDLFSLAKIETLSLEELNFEHCNRIDDGIFSILLQLPKLRCVKLKGTKVTEEATSKFQREFKALYQDSCYVYP